MRWSIGCSSLAKILGETVLGYASVMRAASSSAGLSIDFVKLRFGKKIMNKIAMMMNALSKWSAARGRSGILAMILEMLTSWRYKFTWIGGIIYSLFTCQKIFPVFFFQIIIYDYKFTQIKFMYILSLTIEIFSLRSTVENAAPRGGSGGRRTGDLQWRRRMWRYFDISCIVLTWRWYYSLI